MRSEKVREANGAYRSHFFDGGLWDSTDERLEATLVLGIKKSLKIPVLKPYNSFEKGTKFLQVIYSIDSLLIVQSYDDFMVHLCYFRKL